MLQNRNQKSTRILIKENYRICDWTFASKIINLYLEMAKYFFCLKEILLSTFLFKAGSLYLISCLKKNHMDILTLLFTEITSLGKVVKVHQV